VRTVRNQVKISQKSGFSYPKSGFFSWQTADFYQEENWADIYLTYRWFALWPPKSADSLLFGSHYRVATTAKCQQNSRLWSGRNGLLIFTWLIADSHFGLQSQRNSCFLAVIIASRQLRNVSRIADCSQVELCCWYFPDILLIRALAPNVSKSPAFYQDLRAPLICKISAKQLTIVRCEMSCWYLPDLSLIRALASKVSGIPVFWQSLSRCDNCEMSAK
jgi:hypothetical protein